MFVKKWAKFQNINSAKDQTISSYALTLMVLHYLQYGVRGPPVLPSLQSLYPVSDSGKFYYFTTLPSKTMMKLLVSINAFKIIYFKM